MIKGIQKRTYFALIVSIFALVIAAFRWTIIDWVTPFLMAPIYLFTLVVFVVGFVFSLSCLFKFKDLKWLAVTPVLIQLICLALLTVVPFTKIWLNINFHLYESQREDVVQRINSGDLTPNVMPNFPLIELGPEYSNISKGGNQVVVREIESQNYVMFYTFRGILDNYSGFLYVPSGGDPRNFEDLHEQDSTQIIKYTDHWYYTSHH